jgi:amine acid ABC transporter, permease protein, 3-TM region, His/Glu/Gln/Arg/opine family
MDINYQFLEQTFYLVLAAVPTTLNLTVTSLLLSLPLAFFMALVRLRRTRYVSGFVGAYITLLRGTPIVLQILLIYSLLPSLLHALVGTLGWTINVFDWNPILYAYLVFTLNTTALLAEVFRSALGSIERGQMEAALCAGLTKVQAYVHILIPQALVTALPNICNVTVNLIKGTSLAFLMTVKDMTAVAKVAASYGYNYIEAYLDVFAGYIIICSIVQVLFVFAESHVGRFRLIKQK